MTHQPPPFVAAPAEDPGRQLAQLREALALIDRLAGRQADADTGLDEAAQISARHDQAPPIVQRRFDALAAESVLWMTAGLEALLAAGDPPPRAAAERLADSIRRALAEMRAMVAGQA